MQLLRSLIIVSLLVLSGLHASAQQMEDVVHLTNGSIYRGVIIEQVPNESLKIQIMGGSIIAVNLKDVLKLTKETPYKATTLQSAPTAEKAPREKMPFEIRKKGYFFQGQLMLESLQGGLRIVNGYRFGQFGHVGIGVGFDGVGGSPANDRINGLSAWDLSGIYLPLYVYYAGDILKSKVTPFYALEAGYTHPLNAVSNRSEDYGGNGSTTVERGGAMGGVGIGVRFNTRRRINFSLLLNVNVKNVQYTQNYYLYDDVLGVYDVYGTGVQNATLLHGGLRLGIGF